MPSMRTLVALAMCGLAGSADAQVEPERADGPIASYVGHRVLRVEIRSSRELQTLLALADDVWSHSIHMGEPVDVRVSPERFAAVAAAGLRFTIIINDVQAAFDAEAAQIRALNVSDDATWYTNFHNYTDNKAYVQALAAAYPDIATYRVIGTSLQGREIFALRITGPGSTAHRPASVWLGGQHANEWIPVPVVEYHAEQLLTRYATDPHVKRLVDNHEFYFVPIMNPDGYDYTWTNDRSWRKNRRPNSNNPVAGCNGTFGVDLNSNWGYQWGFSGSGEHCSSNSYPGVAAFSEPESQVMRDFIMSLPRCRLLMDWHTASPGQKVLSPWGYTDLPVTPASQAQLYELLGSRLVAALALGHQTPYVAGSLYSVGSVSGASIDWAWGDRGALAFMILLIEGGPGLIPYMSGDSWPAFLVLADYLTPCYANCDQSTVAPALNVNDFQCFLNQFATGQSEANCDGSTANPLLTAADFQCFLNMYGMGCP